MTRLLNAKSSDKVFLGKREISQSKKVRARHYLGYKEVDKARPFADEKFLDHPS